ncbi:MAG: DUF2191 domain-containing protein [Deltaproteobacteria bacterium]|nr:DUF2191 domain-containing protein [Deltaproteobacteria bacterium]
MRTTIRMDDQLLQEAKTFAAKIGLSLTRLMEEGLKLRLKQAPAKGKSKKIKFPVSKGNCIRPGININSNAELYDLMDEE